MPMFVPLARAAIILTPGANTSGLIRLSFVGPLELKVAIASLLEEAPTVIASFEIPGVVIVYMAGPEFPAATTQTAPCSVAQLT